jgi:D-alanyl-D-alanine carboxypeptidase (penicillin-binding protein 5/6)
MFRTLLCICILTVSFFSLLVFVPYHSPIEQIFATPIPDYLSMAKNKQVTLLDLWFPLLESVYGSEIKGPTLTAESALMYDLSVNKVLFEKNTKEKLPMASLTKIMTAIVSLENKRSDDRYIVRGENLVGEDSMGLAAGEVLSQNELLYGLIMNSGNDAAEVFATNYPEGRDAFVKAMNDKALALGLTDTHFSNPSGLQGDGIQYTTVSDLVVITKYALEKFPLFADVSATYEHHIPATSLHKAYDLYNETNLVSTYPGVKGVKTGYTPEAGMCLITYLDYKGHRILGVILHSENRRLEMKELLDYSLNVLGITPPAHD